MNDIWAIEHRLWLDGPDAYAGLMAPHCVMAFGPMGILQDQAIVDSLREAPRWTGVTMQDQLVVRPSDDVAILAYAAEGRRDGARPYRALCMSTYLKMDHGWRIAQHQQTPLD